MTLTTNPCANCDRPVTVRQTEYARGRGRFCSYSCRSSFGGRLREKPDGELIAARLLAYREKFGMTQRDLAAQMQISPGLIGEMERGRVRSRPAAERVMMLEVG